MATVELGIDVASCDYNGDGGFAIKDAAGKWPSSFTKHQDKVYFHAGTGHLYKIVGIVFQSEQDRWMMAYQRVTSGGLLKGPVFCHLPEDFEREGRFQEVKK